MRLHNPKIMKTKSRLTSSSILIVLFFSCTIGFGQNTAPKSIDNKSTQDWLLIKSENGVSISYQKQIFAGMIHIVLKIENLSSNSAMVSWNWPSAETINSKTLKPKSSIQGQCLPLNDDGLCLSTNNLKIEDSIKDLFEISTKN